MAEPTNDVRVEGMLDASRLRFALLASRFNNFIVERLVGGARDVLVRLGASPQDITVVRVPGAFEIPPVAMRLAESGRFEAIICLGAVIRGETPHFDYVAEESARGVAEVARKAPIPVIYGILTTDSVDQAVDRAGTKSGNRGAEAAMAAVEMSNLYRSIAAGVLPEETPVRPRQAIAARRRKGRA